MKINNEYIMLGELDPEQLWDTTLNPEKAIMTQIHIEDLEESLDITRMLMSKRFTEERRQFLEDNKAFDIDI